MQIKRYDENGNLAGTISLEDSRIVGFHYGAARTTVTLGLMRIRTGEFIMPLPGGCIEIDSSVTREVR